MKLEFEVYGMSCQVCANRITKAVNKVEGVKTCNVSFVNNTMFVEYDENKTNSDLIIKAVVNAGYNAKVKTNIKSQTKHELNFMLWREIISIVFCIPLLYITMFYDKFPQMDFINYHLSYYNIVHYLAVMLILVIPIILINIRIFIKGFKNLFKLSPTMDSLVAVGSTTAFVYTLIIYTMACYTAMTHKDQSFTKRLMGNYFDSCAMILTIVTFGKTLESKAKHKTTISIDKLVQLIPEYAIVLVNGEEVSKRVEEVEVDDLLVIKMGCRVPVDGIVEEGEATLDTSSITGESIGTYVKAGDKVISSSLNQSGRIVVRATTIGADSTMQKIIDLVNEAANSKAPISRVADQVSNFFVPVVMIIALLTFLYWYFVKGEISSAIKCGVSVLVVSCPCALGLATPVAIVASVGKASTFSVISKSAEAIEVASKIKTVIIDKTGTITEGTPKVVKIKAFGVEATEVAQVAYSLEINAVHPLSNAIKEYCEKIGFKPFKVENDDFTPGIGIKGTVNGRNYFLGNEEHIEEFTRIELDIKKQIEKYSSKGYIPLVMSKENSVIGIICVADRIKKSSKQAIKIIKGLGIKVVMATGDNDHTANVIGDIVGVDEVRSRVLPQDKEKIVIEYQNKIKKTHTNVAMIGDGINDSLALVRSDLGIAVGEGSETARDYCDMLLLNSDLLDAANMFRLAKRTMTTIKINLLWALGYNVVLIPIATGLLSNEILSINPMIAAICMCCSSLFVVLTALTINFFEPIKHSDEENDLNNINKNEEENMQKVVKVNGMSCEHCSARVKKAIMALPNVVDVTVDLNTKEVTIEYTESLNLNLVKEAVEKIDYEYLG